MENERQSETVERERKMLLERLEELLEVPMVVLGFAWLILLIVELVWGLSPFLATCSYVIWGVFVVDFGVKLTLAPRKISYVRSNLLTVLALVLPALRISRIARVARVLHTGRAARGSRLIKVLSSMNRGMRLLGGVLGRRGFGYVAVLTITLTFIGAAGMYAFERDMQGQSAFESYGHALWWTAMLMTTMGSDYWPKTSEGRFLCLFIALYAFAVFGYATATIATFFLEQDSHAADEALSARVIREIEGLRAESTLLRRELTDLLERARPKSDS